MKDQKREYLGRLIAEQEASGQTIRAFCKERGISDRSFYFWRKRLETSEPVQFALLKTVAWAAALELILASGERLRMNRLNVAISRARCLAVIVANPRLLEVPCRTVEQVKLVNVLCWAREYAAGIKRVRTRVLVRE